MGEECFYDHTGYTFSIYPSNNPVEISPKYAHGLIKFEDQHQDFFPSLPYDFQNNSDRIIKS